ncbi:MAG: type I-G CRISPR-associated protein, Cas3-extension family [Acidimicrobiia bacterium]
MIPEIELSALHGTNPLGYLAALGVLDVLHRVGRSATLHWTDDLVPAAVVNGANDVNDLVQLLDRDRKLWQSSVSFFGPPGATTTDAKPLPGAFKAWAQAVSTTIENCASPDADLFCALLAEGGIDGSADRKGKPTHLHFTAGNQQFLAMAQALATGLGPEHVRRALFGPWEATSDFKTLRWDAYSSYGRPYALQATAPTDTAPAGVPGADWLALLGLSFFPVRVVETRGGRQDRVVETTACDRAWKRSAFRWPLWSVPIDRDTARSVVADPALVGARDQRTAPHRRSVDGPSELAARGILRILEAPIRRTDRGGYGSFGGAETLVEATRASSPR